MKQCVKFGTRITEHSSTRIDLLYSNEKNVNCDKVDEFQISGHETSTISVPVNDALNMRIVKNFNIWNNCDILIYYLQQFNFSILNNCDIGNKTKFLDDIIIDIMSRITTKAKSDNKINE